MRRNIYEGALKVLIAVWVFFLLLFAAVGAASDGISISGIIGFVVFSLPAAGMFVLLKKSKQRSRFGSNHKIRKRDVGIIGGEQEAAKVDMPEVEIVSAPDDDWIHAAPPDLAVLVIQAREYYLNGDLYMAKTWYDKCAYFSPQVRGDNIKLALKRELTGFAQHDPAYQAMLKEILQIVAEKGEIVQTGLYPLLPYAPEEIRRVTYFAAEVGDLRRTKFKRSYKLSLPPN